MCPLNPDKATCDNPNSHLTTKIKSFRINGLQTALHLVPTKQPRLLRTSLTEGQNTKTLQKKEKTKDQRPQRKALFAVNEDVGYSISYLHRQHLLTKLHPLKYLICRVSSCILKPTILEYARLDFHNNYLAGFFYWISHVFAFQLVLICEAIKIYRFLSSLTFCTELCCF